MHAASGFPRVLAFGICACLILVPVDPPAVSSSQKAFTAPLRLRGATLRSARCEERCHAWRCEASAASSKGQGADGMERFVSPERRVPGHAPLAFFRAFWLLMTIFAVGIMTLPVIGLALPVVNRRDPVRRGFIDRLIMMWSKISVWPFFRVQVLGQENLLPEKQACVYVANHQSFMDILSCYHLPRVFKWVSKASIVKIPIIGLAMKATHTILIQREDKRSQLATFRECVDFLQKDTSIFVFPEGTRSASGALIEFKKGPFAMAKRAGVPLVPITIRGTGRLMPSKKEYFLFRNSAGVEVVVHPPVSVKEIQDSSDTDLISRVRDTIESALPAAQRRESAPLGT
eukprot:TRINITY_DN7553_c0_g1_i2.p1 TRINITY_DN7553_c0_g1~~TRINITY_DN7553_c0_g1_i2.p1  ORF type:complete len:345 (-),score=55.19 TRINITY_DN7553_c0_g1_i2:89-1123(-)